VDNLEAYLGSNCQEGHNCDGDGGTRHLVELNKGVSNSKAKLIAEWIKRKNLAFLSEVGSSDFPTKCSQSI
jgi:hypothetical protein